MTYNVFSWTLNPTHTHHIVECAESSPSHGQYVLVHLK